jgi:hypothetical protein
LFGGCGTKVKVEARYKWVRRGGLSEGKKNL